MERNQPFGTFFRKVRAAVVDSEGAIRSAETSQTVSWDHSIQNKLNGRKHLHHDIIVCR
jgi:hypothetical protein